MNRKLTPEMLRSIVLEEMKKLREENLSKKQKTPAEVADDTREVEAGEYADTLEKHIDMLKALKVKEAKLRSALKNLDEQKQKLIKKISG